MLCCAWDAGGVPRWEKSIVMLQVVRQSTTLRVQMNWTPYDVYMYTMCIKCNAIVRRKHSRAKILVYIEIMRSGRSWMPFTLMILVPYTVLEISSYLRTCFQYLWVARRNVKHFCYRHFLNSTYKYVKESLNIADNCTYSNCDYCFRPALSNVAPAIYFSGALRKHIILSRLLILIQILRQKFFWMSEYC
jgi:hypothetical protein